MSEPQISSQPASAAIHQLEGHAARTADQLRLIMNVVPAYLAYIDRNLRYVHVNQTYERSFGRTYAEIVGHSVAEVLGNSYENVRPSLEAALRGETRQFETRMGTVHDERILLVSHLPDRDESGEIRGIVIYGHDVTERRRIEEELRAQQERLHRAQQVGNIASWEWDVHTTQILWNDGSALVYGRSLQELAPTSRYIDFVHPDDRQLIRDSLHAVFHGQTEFSIEFRVVWPDESIHWLASVGRMILTSTGEPLKLIGVNLDITDRKRSELALLRTEKLAAVGRLASSIAHEINNPLESITNLIYLAALNPNLDEQTRTFLDMADSELRRVSNITAQTLRFHRQTANPVEVDVSQLVHSVLAFYANRLTDSHAAIRTAGLREARVRCREGDIRQVLNNLIGNALDALKVPGRLILRTRRTTQWSTGNTGVRITVADSGEGMSPITRARAFEAFYTTKGPNGNGLGLWVSSEIVENHHGTIRVRSSRQPATRGTVFSVFLPDTNPAPNPAKPSA